MNDSDFHVFSLVELSLNNIEEAVPQKWQLKNKIKLMNKIPVEEIYNFILRKESVCLFSSCNAVKSCDIQEGASWLGGSNA